MGVFDFLPGLDRGGGGDGAEQSGDATEERSAELTQSDIRKRVESLIGRSDVPTLDFSVDSLARLDDLAAGPPSPVDDELAYGAYLGETLVRQFDGEWVRADGWRVAFDRPDDRTTVAVFDAAAMSVAGDPVFADVAARLEAEAAEHADTAGESTGPGDADELDAGDADGSVADPDADDGRADDRERTDGGGVATDEPAGTVGAVAREDGAAGETTDAREDAAGADAATDRDDLRAAAAAFADDWPARDLDFTPGSLARLDALVDGWDDRSRADSPPERPVVPGDGDDPLVPLGAYYGEVLVRALDGEWTGSADDAPAVSVPGSDGTAETVRVFAAARECLAPPSTFAYRYDALVNRSGVDERPVSDGRRDVFDATGDALTAGDAMTQFAAAAETFVEARPEYPLDYSPRSLGHLDDLVATELPDEDGSDVALADGTDADSLRLTARATAVGAYFAAVLLRHCGAQWRVDDGDAELVIDGAGEERTVDPVATAVDCLRGEDSFERTYASVCD